MYVCVCDRVDERVRGEVLRGCDDRVGDRTVERECIHDGTDLSLCRCDSIRGY